MFARFQRSVTSKHGLATVLSLLVVAMLTGFWLSSALADTLGPQQNISNDSTQDLSPTIAQDPQGNLHAVWDAGSGGSRTVRYVKGTWNGSGYSFGASVQLASVGTYGYSTPSIAVSPNGTVMATWSNSGGTLQGQTWNSSQSQPSGSPASIMPGIQSSVSADPSNRFHIVANGNFAVQYCQFENGSCTDQESFSPNASNRPHVAADSNGNIHVVWDQNNGILYRSRPAGGAFGGIETLSSTGNFASIAPDGRGSVHIAYSANFVIQYCQRTFGQPCTNQHTLQAGSSDLAPSVGATSDGIPFVAFRDSGQGLFWYDTREGGNWGGTRVLSNSAPSNLFVSARPYSNRFSIVWSGSFQIQHIFDTVSGTIPPPITATPVTVGPPAIGSLVLNNGNPYSGPTATARITATGGQATSYTLTVNGQTVSSGAFAPDGSGGQTVTFALPAAPSCQAVTVVATLSGPGGSSSPVSATTTYIAGVQATAVAVNPHLPSDTRPVGNVGPGAVVTNYGDPGFTRERYAFVYIDATSGECSGLNGYFLGHPTDTVSSVTDPRWQTLTYIAPVINLPPSVTNGQTFNFKVFLRDGAGNITTNGIPASITYDITPPTVTAGSNPVPTTPGPPPSDIAQLNLASIQATDTIYQQVRTQPYWGVSVLVTTQPTVDSGDPAWDQYGTVNPGVLGSTLNWNLYFANTTQPPAPGKPYYVHLRFVDGAGNVASTVINSGPVTPQAFTSRTIQFLPLVAH